ncbi:hypothetical protein L6164_034295 [Bauhinia variegata]|uniref:Uncharacterized protein n=1 Tax=Bauhinia variegata TaxID=167791 RepID=A0ACB9KUE1_BAUVA|nr:hypothetical protein L6164_034295 [Bauhinia variegata]
MYQTKKFSTGTIVPHKAQGSSERLANVGVLAGPAVKNAAPAGGSGKQRLRWTSDLHDRFVDAITQLGGPDSGYFLLSVKLRSRKTFKDDKCFKRSICASVFYHSLSKEYTLLLTYCKFG